MKAEFHYWIPFIIISSEPRLGLGVHRNHSKRRKRGACPRPQHGSTPPRNSARCRPQPAFFSTASSTFGMILLPRTHCPSCQTQFRLPYRQLLAFWRRIQTTLRYSRTQRLQTSARIWRCSETTLAFSKRFAPARIFLDTRERSVSLLLLFPVAHKCAGGRRVAAGRA